MIFCFVVIFVFAVFKILSPLISDSNNTSFPIPESHYGTKTNQLLNRKQKLLEAYEDLEFDKSTQKLSDEDYIAQKNILLSEIKELYVALDTSS